MTIIVIGLGYVGLTTALTFAHQGKRVIGVDIDEERIIMLDNGRLPIHEEGLDDILFQTLGKEFTVTSDLGSVVAAADTFFICVDTPTGDDGRINLHSIENVARNLGRHFKDLDSFKTVVVKSTVIPGTTRHITKIIEEVSGKRAGQDFGIAMIPEFLREGRALRDALDPDRIVIGCEDPSVCEHLSGLFNNYNCPTVEVSLETAEFSKYASNSFLALKISFANELANIIDIFNSRDSSSRASISDVVEIMGLDSRINPAFLGAGIGFGGSCFPKDVKALASFSEDLGYHARLLRGTLDVNESQPNRAVELLEEELGDLAGKRITVLGLAFKPDTDDVREAPSLKIISELVKKGSRVQTWDPVAEQHVKNLYPDIIYYDHLQESLTGIDGAIIATEWSDIINYLERCGDYPFVLIDGRGVVPRATRSIGQPNLRDCGT
ncbi:MAG: UDP-glucose dehydrogenase family protein [Candidatus Odinarchaeota archaeon]